MTTTPLLRFYSETVFGGFSDIDGTVRFYTRIRALLQEKGSGAAVLDVGCGRGEYGEDEVAYRRGLRIFKGAARVVGIDVDPGAALNPHLDEFHLIQSEQWPVEGGCFDLCVADWVVEHAPDPKAFLAECFRVLKPGGYLCVRTLNRHSYVGIASRAIPSRSHGRVLKRVQQDRKEEDVFPTLYRCNTIQKMRKMLASCGFAAVVYTIEAEPSYLGFSTLAYFLGVLHQRYAPSWLRTTIVAFAKKADLGKQGTPEVTMCS